jgi:pimeloyl-ACP methyl ester carboxylesterase
MQLLAFTIPAPAEVEIQRLTPPAISRLGEVRAPTLIVVGEQDVQGVLTLADRLEAEIAGAQKVVMPRVAHLPNMEQPEQFNRIVFDFLQTTK